MKFHLDSNIVEGTPEELVKYQELLKEKEKEEELLRFSHEHQLTKTEQRAIDNFKGLLGSLKVKNSYASSTESSTDEEEEDTPMGYTFWYLDDVKFNKFVVLKTTIDGYFETSKGMRYTYQSVIDLIKPIDRADVREEFERAKDERVLLNYYPVIDSFMNSY